MKTWVYLRLRNLAVVGAQRARAMVRLGMVRVGMALLDMGFDDHFKVAAPAPNRRRSDSRWHEKAEKPTLTGGPKRAEGPATELSLSSVYGDDPRAYLTMVKIGVSAPMRILALTSPVPLWPRCAWNPVAQEAAARSCGRKRLSASMVAIDAAFITSTMPVTLTRNLALTSPVPRWPRCACNPVAQTVGMESRQGNGPAADECELDIDFITTIKVAMLMMKMIGCEMELTLDMNGSILRESAAALACGSGKALHGGARRSRMRTS